MNSIKKQHKIKNPRILPTIKPASWVGGKPLFTLSRTDLTDDVTATLLSLTTTVESTNKHSDE